METWCHEILYLRQVYPRDTFAPTKFLGVSCHACRHAGVVCYITTTLGVIVPSILSGSVTHVSLVLMKDAFTIDETYTLIVSSSVLATNTDNDDSLEVLQQTERCLRDLILSVLSLEGLPKKKWTNDASFKLTMQTAEQKDDYCHELTTAFDQGTWYRPNRSDGEVEANPNEKVRPLHHVSLPNGGTLQMNLITSND